MPFLDQPIQLLGAGSHLGLQMRPSRTAHLERGRPLHLRHLARPLALYALHLLLRPSRLDHRVILQRGLPLRGRAGAELPTPLLERGREARELCVAHLLRARVGDGAGTRVQLGLGPRLVGLGLAWAGLGWGLG